MSIDQLRAAFLDADESPRRLRAWREERLRSIQAGERRMMPGPCIVVHVIPLDAFSASPMRLDVARRVREFTELSPLPNGQFTQRVNVDGVVSEWDRGGDLWAFAQLNRSGVVEAALVRSMDEQDRQIHLVDLENVVVSAVRRFLMTLRTAGAGTPLAVGLAVVRAKGATFAGPPRVVEVDPVPQIERDIVSTDFELVESFEDDVPLMLRPAFDVFWNAGGRPQSTSYEGSGQFAPKPQS